MARGLIKEFDNDNDKIIKIDGRKFKTENANRAYSLSKPDTRTLRFEVRNGDPVHSSDLKPPPLGSDRSEISQLFAEAVGKGKTVDIEFDFLIEPGTLVSGNWNCIAQWHATDDKGEGRPPPWALNLLSGDRPRLELRYGYYNNETLVAPWTGGRIPRNTWHQVRTKTRFLRNDKGRCQFWFNNIKVVDRHGPLGYNDTNYWKMGIYRRTANEVLAVRIRFITMEILD